MVCLTQGRRYSTGTLVSTDLDVTLRDGRRVVTAKVELRGKVVDAVIEDRHVDAFRRTVAVKRVGCRILMEHEHTWDTWTVHHIAESATWAALAEPRVKPIEHRIPARLDMAA